MVMEYLPSGDLKTFLSVSIEYTTAIITLWYVPFATEEQQRQTSTDEVHD